MMVVEKGSRVTGLVVLMDPFLLDWVAQHTTFHDFDTSISVSDIQWWAKPVGGLQFQKYVPIGSDNLASIYPTYSMLSPSPFNIN